VKQAGLDTLDVPPRSEHKRSFLHGLDSSNTKLNYSLLILFRNLMFHLPLIFYGNPSENMLSGYNRGRGHQLSLPIRSFSRLRPSGSRTNLAEMAKSLSQAEEKNADPQKPSGIDATLEKSKEDIPQTGGLQTPLDPNEKAKYRKTGDFLFVFSV